MATLDLKPCPFCGKDGQIAPDEIGSGGQHVPPYHAGCLRGAGCGIAFTADDPDEAIAEWNRRALSTVTPAEVGAQTEARAIARWAVLGCGVPATLEKVDPIAEAIATALAAKDAELEKVKAECDKWREAFGEMHRQTMRAEAQLAEANKALDEAQKKLRRCQWYWPKDDTSSEYCADSAQEVVQNAYDWQTPSGEVVGVARGGIVNVTYCAALPPADDADSDDDFWIEEDTAEAAKALIDAEIARRAREAQGGE